MDQKWTGSRTAAAIENRPQDPPDICPGKDSAAEESAAALAISEKMSGY